MLHDPIQEFFDKLDGGTTVSRAAIGIEASSFYTPSDMSGSLKFPLRVLEYDDTVIIDLAP